MSYTCNLPRSDNLLICIAKKSLLKQSLAAWIEYHHYKKLHIIRRQLAHETYIASLKSRVFSIWNSKHEFHLLQVHNMHLATRADLIRILSFYLNAWRIELQDKRLIEKNIQNQRMHNRKSHLTRIIRRWYLHAKVKIERNADKGNSKFPLK